MEQIKLKQYYCNNCRKKINPYWKDGETSKGFKIRIGYCPYCSESISYKLKETWE